MAQYGLPPIIEALQTVHGAQSSNEDRQRAFHFLEQAKANPEAPSNGYELARDKSQPSVARHYGLSLLEHAIKHSWRGYSPEQALVIREWVVTLAEGISEEDPIYLRNKFGQLWVEIVKRTWGRTWMNMDEMLFNLFSGNLIQKELCLFILVTISEETFKHLDSQDQLASIRSGEIRQSDLSRACIQVFTPADILASRSSHSSGGKHDSDHAMNLRFGEEGWLVRLWDLVDYCLDHDPEGNAAVRSCAIKTLEAINSATIWQITESHIRARVIQRGCRSLSSGCFPVQKVSYIS
jgi:exportin-5